MKIAVAVLSFLTATTEAFAPLDFVRRTGLPSSLRAVSGGADASNLIKEAMALSDKYGKDSSEARLAWEAVEELNSADNTVATKGSLNEECDVTEEMIDEACIEYGEKLDELNRLLEENSPMIGKSLADNVQPIKLADVPQQKSGAPSPELQEAVATAKRLTEEKGVQSSEARIAWETVEEIASASEKSEALGGKLTDECIVDAAKEACAALEELNRVLNLNKD